jgi:hypothetical protein
VKILRRLYFCSKFELLELAVQVTVQNLEIRLSDLIYVRGTCTQGDRIADPFCQDAHAINQAEPNERVFSNIDQG